ncbi:MAG: glycogen synthase [Gemmatimonadetes bacterium]|nr:glycogen synthase [Gemmatimonadota bacterium]
MRISLFTNEYPPHVYGGAGVHVEYLARELARADGAAHQVEVLCFGEQREASGNLSVRGIGAPAPIPAQDPRHTKLFDTLARDLAMAGAATTPDIVHCHTWYAHMAGLLAKPLSGAKLVLTTHSLEPHRPWKEEQLGSAYRATSWVERTAYENADGVIAVSQAMKADVESLYGVDPARVRVIHNGIDTDEYSRRPAPEVLARVGVDPSVPMVLFVGRITRQKGIMHLVRALPLLDAGMQVVLCAGAPDTPEIAAEMKAEVELARAASQVTIHWLPEMLSKADAIALYSHASLFVCPSVYEPFGIINLEAMACETPVVASAVGGIPEIIVDGETGVLVPPGDPAAIAREVNALMRDPERRARMAAAGRARVVEKFSWSSIAVRTIEFYRELLQRP